MTAIVQTPNQEATWGKKVVALLVGLVCLAWVVSSAGVARAASQTAADFADWASVDGSPCGATVRSVVRYTPGRVTIRATAPQRLGVTITTGFDATGERPAARSVRFDRADDDIADENNGAGG